LKTENINNPIKIYNTLTAQKEPFVPHKENEVKMYVCGPTVYNLLHVGNMRCYVVFDTVRRFLESRNYKVTMVQNFTDIDDKIIAQAQTDGTSAAAVSEKYINEAKIDYQSLNICPAENYPQVTQEIPTIIEMIAELISAGFAYEKGGHVFFATEKFTDYGKLSKKNIADLIAGARVAINEEKNSPVDFVLWKPVKTETNSDVENVTNVEPFWESPWGKGRPGWHIECSAMARKYLGQVDIHGGGEDLIFPHHENEIAQSEALTNLENLENAENAAKKPFAKYWMHNGALTSGHKKMSKSLGNFFTFREVAEKFSPQIIRFFLLSGHYRMPMEYSEELLESAKKGLDRIKNCWTRLAETSGKTTIDRLTDRERELLMLPTLGFVKDFYEKMSDDFNTADAISVIFELVKYANVSLNTIQEPLQKSVGEQILDCPPQETLSKEMTNLFLENLEKLCNLLGIDIAKYAETAQTSATTENSAQIEELIAKRQQARESKDWATADKIRDELTKLGVVVKDAPATRGTKK